MLNVRGLSLRYPTGKLALADFSLTASAGELVIVLGGNGSGKTTLLRCITRADADGGRSLGQRRQPDTAERRQAASRPARFGVDIAIFGTFAGVIMALPLAVLAAANVTPSRVLYYAARSVFGFARAVPDLVWALFFVTVVGLGPFPGGLALAVHSIGMLGRLFAETIKHMDMAPIDALALTGACKSSRMASCPACSLLFSESALTDSTRTSARRSSWVSSARAASASCS